MKVLKLESTAPFQGLPELVAYKEGLFEKEGLQIEWIEREHSARGPDHAQTTPKGANPFASHGSLLERGKADMYNACEWGNYCRVQDTSVGSRQIGRRAIVTYTAIMVRPESKVFTPQQLADVTVGVPFYFGSHYAAIQLMEGFLPRERISLCNAPNGSQQRYEALMRGDVEATTLTEPYITLAEKQGCRIVCGTLYHGTEVASDKVDVETYTAFNKAVLEAVKRINADKAAYMHYFIDYYADRDPKVAQLKPSDLRESRIVITEPAAIPDGELSRTYEWLKSWGMLENTVSAFDLVNTQVQTQAHAAE
ncbi:MAG: ABC-type nitrate/sulfonate/bicarbonate transport system periplasmic component-like protein [Hyphomicrobiales bacterium]|nr:ABC-type nitrate/sulfonate/bicarbonate transport system periplasmic component-like protein [Hyphomicrobiales bacterium]